ncbi:MAG: TetR family transcriptional regulator [Anaerosomatales bacterium]
MSSARSTDDRTAAARIRDAAIVSFGQAGFDKTTVREIAAAAGVSPGLILHHFGSKAGLRAACDEHVIAEFARSRNEAVDSGTTDPFAAMAGIEREAPMMRYLLQSLREGSEAAAALFDGLVEESARLMEHSVEEGQLRPSDNIHDMAVILVAWQFGGLLLQEHVARAFGAEPLTAAPAPRHIRAVLEILTHGVFADSRYEDAWNNLESSGEPPPHGETTAPGRGTGSGGGGSAARKRTSEAKER